MVYHHVLNLRIEIMNPELPFSQLLALSTSITESAAYLANTGKPPQDYNLIPMCHSPQAGQEQVRHGFKIVKCFSRKSFDASTG